MVRIDPPPPHFSPRPIIPTAFRSTPVLFGFSIQTYTVKRPSPFAPLAHYGASIITVPSMARRQRIRSGVSTTQPSIWKVALSRSLATRE